MYEVICLSCQGEFLADELAPFYFCPDCVGGEA